VALFTRMRNIFCHLTVDRAHQTSVFGRRSVIDPKSSVFDLK